MNDDLSKLMHDAVSGVGGQAPAEQLVGRLAAVDRRRKFGVMVTAATAMVLATFGVAAAWPENQAPIRLELGDEVVEDDTGDVDEDARAEIVDDEPEAEEPVAENDPVVEDTTEESAEPDFVLDLDLSDLELPDPTPTPEPTPVPPAPTATPAPQPAPPAAPPQGGGGGGEESGSGGGGDGHADEGGQHGGQEESHHEESGSGGGEEEHSGGGEGGEGGGQVAFSASAQYGSCEEPIPYDNYSGTAAPGATVTITSPWSATTTATADSSGHWAVQVTFEAAPVDEPFTVTISSGGESVGLGFVRTG